MEDPVEAANVQEDDSGAAVGQLRVASARVPEHVVYREFASETVMLNLETGKYHGLNPTAGRMLDAIGKAATLEAAAETLASEYQVATEDLLNDLLSFCLGLEGRGLLEILR